MNLIDTDIFIDLFRNQEEAEEFFESLDFSESLFSAITESELLAGSSCNDNNVEERILHFLAGMEKIEVDNSIAQKAGKLRRQHDLKLPDCIIASTALLNDATLYSRNLKDFKQIEGLDVRKPY